MKSIKVENVENIIEPIRKEFNDFMNYTNVKDQLKWQDVHEEFFRLELGCEPKNKVLNRFILSVLGV